VVGSGLVRLWVVVSGRTGHTIEGEVFQSPDEAESFIAEVASDDADLADKLYVAELDLGTGRN
jgi:hypothetical protein